jgi:hypothetical protein
MRGSAGAFVAAISDTTLESAVIMGRTVLANKWAAHHWEALGVVPAREEESKQTAARGRA